MAYYTRTGTFINGGAPGISAAFLNNIESVFARQVGDTEVGAYYLGGWGNAASDTLSQWMLPTSRGSAVAASVAVDTSIDAATGVNAPSTNRLTINGFHVFTTTTGAGTNVFVGGLFTLTF